MKTGAKDITKDRANLDKYKDSGFSQDLNSMSQLGMHNALNSMKGFGQDPYMQQLLQMQGNFPPGQNPQNMEML